MKRILCIVAGILLLFGLVPYLAAYLVVVHPICLHSARQTPSAYHLPYEDVAFPATDGLNLSGWLMPVEKAKGIIVLCHGVFEDRTGLMDLAPVFREAGYSVLAFDFRQRGKSGRKRNTIGKDEVNDLLGAVRYLRQRIDTQHLPIGVVGASMGGAVALMGTARCRDIKAVVADSAYAQMEHAIRQHLWLFFGPFQPLLARLTLWHGKRLLGFEPKSVSVENEIGRISPRPILLIHSRRDFMIWSSEAQRLYKSANEPKELWLLPRGRHTKGRYLYPRQYREKVVRFFNNALGDHQPAKRPDVSVRGIERRGECSASFLVFGCAELLFKDGRLC